jgi:hypothetical protein
LSRRFWLLVGSALLGLAVTDLTFFLQNLPLWLIVTANAGTILMFTIILWCLRHRFFPKDDISPPRV